MARMNRLGTLVAAATIASVALGGCSRNRQEAVIKANEAKQEKDANPDGAVAKYQEATKLDPTNHRIFFALGMLQKKKEDYDAASATFATAARLAPEYANYWLEDGYAMERVAMAQKTEKSAQTAKYEAAKEPLQHCIEKDPNFADCYEELGNCFLWTDDEQKAMDNYNKAIEHDPTQVRYYAALADLYIRLGFMQQAEQVLKEAKTFAKPGDKALFGVHVLLSQVYQDKGSDAEMVTELEAAKQVAGGEGPESVQILYSLGSTYAKLKPPRTQEAIQMLKGFNTRACKGAKAQSFKTECETSQTLVQQLGGTMQ